MIDNHELDDFVNNEDLKEKLCKLQTSEEVLELLKKYNYNENKEVFEVELMDLLKEFVGEEELLKVSGGKLNKQSFSNIVTSLAITGALCMPVQGVTGVQQKEKQEDKKSSYSVGLPKGAKIGIGVAGIIGVGVILEEVLRRTIFTRRNDNIENDNNGTKDQISRDITPEQYEEMHKHFMKIATRPGECTPDDFKKYALRELADYMLEEMIHWFKCMKKYCQIDKEGNYEIDSETVQSQKDELDFPCRWNGSLRFLVCVHLAEISLRARLGNIEENELTACLNYIHATRISTDLETATTALKTWVIDENKLASLGVANLRAPLLSTSIEVKYCVIEDSMQKTVLAYAKDWENSCQRGIMPPVSNDRLKKLEDKLKAVTVYTESAGYKRLRDQMNVTK